MAEKRGGKRAGAGRKPGSQARATKEQKGTLGELARQYTNVAMATLVRVARKSESDSAATAAAIAILDRGFGKPSQSHEHTGAGGGPIQHLNLEDLTDEQLAALRPVIAGLATSSDTPEGH